MCLNRTAGSPKLAASMNGSPDTPHNLAKEPQPITVVSTPMIGNYQLPPLDFLQHPDPTVKPTESKEELMANARSIQQTLAQFDIEVALGDITKGPTITRYELHAAPGVRLEDIAALSNNLAAALKAEGIRILTSVPGKSSVGVEVTNPVQTSVIMRDILESEEWRNTKARIPLALGKDLYGHPIIADLAEMPHMLIAGRTGSGKSVCINAIISSLLYRFSPDQIRFVMIDPRGVELQPYNALPHMIVPVVTDSKNIILALRWVVNETEKRYQIFARVGVRSIESFNSRPKNKLLPPLEPELPLLAKKELVEPGVDGFAAEVDEEIVVPCGDDIVMPEKLSYIVVIIDELADLMLVTPTDIEMAITHITQMARAAGIHFVLATGQANLSTIAQSIKSEVPARIAFRCESRLESHNILGVAGAERLLGKGDLLYLPPGSSKLIRAQGTLITDQEIQCIVDFIAKQAKPSYELEIHQQLSRAGNCPREESGIDEDEEIIQDCIEVIRSEQKASVSLLQRRLRLGYGRAARIMDELENRGIVGPSKGADPRDILVDLDMREPCSSTEMGNATQTTELNFTYTCPHCGKDCSVVESLTGQNVACPNCSQDFYASPINVETSQADKLNGRTPYTLPAKLPFFKSGRKQLLAARLVELAADGELDETDRQELACMAADLALSESDIVELQQEQLIKEFQPINLRMQSVLMLTDEDQRAIQQLEKKYGAKLSLGGRGEVLRASYILATTRRLPAPIQIGLLLSDSEMAYHAVRTTWHQTRVNNYSFAGPSISIPIIKGVRYRIASYDVVRSEGMTPLSSGVLYVTSKRLLFAGESRNTAVILSRIINLQIFKDALKVDKSTGKSDLFSMEAEQASYITALIGVIRESSL